jgi:hypothetical protein
MSSHAHRGGIEKPPVNNDHPYNVNDRVAIFIIDGSVVFEEWADVVASCISYPHWYRVRFLNEQLDRIRLVLPASLHTDPLLSCAFFSELLRTRGVLPFDDLFSHPKTWGAPASLFVPYRE